MRVLCRTAVVAGVLLASAPAFAQRPAPRYEALTVDNVVRAVSASTLEGMGSCVAKLEGGDIRWRNDGGDPSPSVGTLMSAGTVLKIGSVADARLARFVRTDTTDGLLHVTCFAPGGETDVTGTGATLSGTIQVGTQDTEDGTVATGQTTGLAIALNYAYNTGTGNWERAGQATGGIGDVDADTTRTVEASDESHSVISAASNNATNVKAAAGVLRTMAVVNTTSTVYYMRFYDLATAPTCSSATGFKFTLPIPPDNGGWSVPLNVGFDTGIGYCITGGGSATDDTAAATGIFGVVTFK